MEVKFDKRCKSKWTDRQWELIKDAVRLFLDQHHMWHVPGKLVIRVGAVIGKGPTRGEFYRANYGRNYEIIVVKRRLFTQTLETLMHELTHCYQVVSGKLIDVWGEEHIDHHVWAGEKYTRHPDPIDHDTWKQYCAVPWEVHARENARTMVKLWYQLNPRRGLDWLLFWRY